MYRAWSTKLEAVQFDLVAGVESQIGESGEQALHPNADFLATEPFPKTAVSTECEGSMRPLSTS